MRAVVERAWGDWGGMRAGYLAELEFVLRQNEGINSDERWSCSGPEYIVLNTVPLRATAHHRPANQGPNNGQRKYADHQQRK